MTPTNISSAFIPMLTSIKVQPYDPTSRIVHTHPGFELMSERSHFLIFGRMNGLAVALHARNAAYANSRGRRSRKTFFINVRDTETNSVIASRTKLIELDSSTLETDFRVDIPLRRDDIIHRRTYSVEAIIPGDDKDPVAAKEILFIDPMGVLPTRFYTIIGAGIVRHKSHIEGIDTCAYYREASADIWDDPEFRVTFWMEECVRDKFGFLPELYARVETDFHSEMMPVEISAGSLNDEHPDCLTADVRLITQRFNMGHTLRVHLQCMGHTIATALFITDGYGRQGLLSEAETAPVRNICTPQAWHEAGVRRSQGWDEAEEARRLEESRPCERTGLEKLGAMVGLEDVKAKVTAYSNLMKFFKMREEAGLATKYPPLHAMFLGAPGTGKTTVAKIMGQVLRECGVLSSGHVVVRERSSLIGQFYSSEAEKTLEAIEEAQGGILFIDEAYQLHIPADPKDPGARVIDTLMTALADESRRDWMLILGGYTEPTMRLLELNPGLASRIPAANIYRFSDFGPDELMEIATRYFATYDFTLTHNARVQLRDKIEADFCTRGKDFGNGRYVINMIETVILPAMATRLSMAGAVTPAELSTVRSVDIPHTAAEIHLATPGRAKIGFVG